MFQNGTKKKIRLFFLFIARWCQFNPIELEIRLGAKIQSPSNAKMASHLTFFFAAGLAFAPPTHRTRVQRENFLSVFPRCAAKARGATSPERRIQIQRRGIAHSFARFKREGAKNAASKKRVAKRALFSSETCAVPFFFFGGISSSVGIVGLRCFYHSRGGKETRTQLE